jgi:predicted dehydrogenase
LKIELTGWNRATRLISASGAVEELPAEERNFTRELLGFVASVRVGRVLPPLATYADGVKALAVAQAARRALETGGTQWLAP